MKDYIDEYLEENFTPPEILDVLEVFKFGASKYAPWSYLEQGHPSMNLKSRTKSIMNHVAEGSYNQVKIDDESGLHHYLHAIAGLIMLYTREKRGIK
jgi:hypothetical protein